MASAVLKVNQSKIQEMQQYYSNYLQTKVPQGGIFTAKPPSCSVTAYKSGKVLFQGKDAEIEAKKWGETIPSKAKSSSIKSIDGYAPPEHIASMSIIGSDEVGTGDYFGPMTVVAAFVSKDQLLELRSLGVKDSKNLKDNQICEIAKSIIPVIPHSLLILHNDKYNEMQKKGMSQGKMKALLHNQAINHLIKKVKNVMDVEGVLIDQFVVPDIYYKHIQSSPKDWKGKTFFSTKAEGVHMSVAAASIIARYAFVKEFDKLSDKAGFELQKGAGAKVDQIAAKLIRTKGEEALKHFTKLHFANTEKAKKLV